jgi:hypothetical protein
MHHSFSAVGISYSYSVIPRSKKNTKKNRMAASILEEQFDQKQFSSLVIVAGEPVGVAGER